ncbi:hypothetical protein [Facilibium subflavum]|uniref:hypothetical protein n=1 Tax=Facilibium subflavum TaxID=2219058 RepID=UPI000E653B05|nr:hypothetical protein [Facilibium subflavum]
MQRIALFFLLIPLISSCSNPAQTHQVYQYKKIIGRYINKHYHKLLSALHKKDIARIDFHSVTVPNNPFGINASRCIISTNLHDEYSAYPQINAIYHLEDSTSVPCSMDLILDYDAVKKQWDTHIYNFNPDDLALPTLNKSIKNNIDIGFKNLRENL